MLISITKKEADGMVEALCNLIIDIYDGQYPALENYIMLKDIYSILE